MKEETLKEIIAWLRDPKIKSPMRKTWREALANRLEEVAKREKAQHGNAAAMREVLKTWIAFAEWLLENAGKDKLGEAIRENGPIIRQRLEELRAALSAPPRNCDVGTPEELGERCMAQFDQWRRKGDGKKLITAIMAWLETPYEAQEGAAK